MALLCGRLGVPTVLYCTVCVGLFTIAPRPVAGHGSPAAYSTVLYCTLGEMCSFIFAMVSSVVVVVVVVQCACQVTAAVQ